MSKSSLDLQLDMLEAQFSKVKQSLLSGSPATLQAASATLQRLAVEFIQFADAVGRAQLATPARIRRIKALSEGLGTLRECQLRQVAYVERALAIVLPGAREKPTYPGATGAYGNAARRSGTFSGFAA